MNFLDLSVPQFGLPLYDYVMSLEVGEHIPAKFESTFLDNLVRYAKIGIILSWAVPGQGGYAHVNNRPLTYVVAQMDQRGFSRNESLSVQMQKVSTYDWLRRKVNYYYRRAV